MWVARAFGKRTHKRSAEWGGVKHIEGQSIVSLVVRVGIHVSFLLDSGDTCAEEQQGDIADCNVLINVAVYKQQCRNAPNGSREPDFLHEWVLSKRHDESARVVARVQLRHVARVVRHGNAVHLLRAQPHGRRVCCGAGDLKRPTAAQRHCDGEVTRVGKLDRLRVV